MIYSRRRPSRQASFCQGGFGDPGWRGTFKKDYGCGERGSYWDTARGIRTFVVSDRWCRVGGYRFKGDKFLICWPM